jgi:epoxyqueuosine reductase
MQTTACNSDKLKAEAKRLGFFGCGISAARRLDEEEENLRKWLDNGQNAGMIYMERHFEMRLDPRLLLPGTKSVISLIYPYFPHKIQSTGNLPIISKYAYGEDYNVVIKDRLNQLIDSMKSLYGNFTFRIFTDSAPILEKKWAQLSGLGWIGKNRNLIVKNAGSFFFIAEILCDLVFNYDLPAKNYCGTCTKCIDACPTQALSESNGLDAGKCISYLTIENKSDIPKQFKGKFSNRIFGCDICQDVCPHNKKPILHNNERFIPKLDWLNFTFNDWNQLSKTDFESIFRKSAVKRAKFDGFKRNLDFINPELIQ